MAERDLQKGKETRHVNPFAEGSLDGPVRFRGSRGRLSSAHSAAAADCNEDLSIVLRKMRHGRVAMEEHRDRMEREEPENPSGTSTARWLAIAAGTAIVAACLAAGYGYHQQTLVGQLTGQQEQMRATVGQLQGQIESLTGKLNEVSTAQQAAAAAAAQVNTPAAKQAAGRRSAVENKRLKELQARMEDQQKQRKGTQEEVAKTRSDLEGNLSATRDDLNGSIARTHEELVALQKRGERSYVEFNLPKSKQFQRSGPLMLSLRKADTKHKSFDLAMIVDDNQLSKKKVNLYEP